MRLLIDTHVFIWYVTDAPDLPQAFIDSIEDGRNKVFVSAVSIWEAVIKFRLGKLKMKHPPAVYLSQQREAHGFDPLVIDEDAMVHLELLKELDEHKDPFDRLLVAQAIQHDLTLVTVDRAFANYPVRTLPNDRGRVQ